jgi:excisionase family DNA binding protein
MSDANDDVGYVSIADAAKYFGISTKTVYRLMETAELPYTKIGYLRRIPRAALDALAGKEMRNPHLIPVKKN